MAAAVVDGLKARLLPAQQISSRHRTDSTEAYTEYLLGNQLRARDTPEANQRSVTAFRKAVVLDPGYAAAYSGLADAEWRVADMSIGEAGAYQRATTAADKAIALAPDSPEGYWARGLLRSNYCFDLHGAETDLQKALALDANFVPAQVQYASLLATFARRTRSLCSTSLSLSTRDRCQHGMCSRLCWRIPDS